MRRRDRSPVPPSAATHRQHRCVLVLVLVLVLVVLLVLLRSWSGAQCGDERARQVRYLYAVQVFHTVNPGGSTVHGTSYLFNTCSSLSA